MTEFTGIDFEISWVDSHEDVMVQAENLLAHSYKAVKDKHYDKILEHFGVELEVPATPPFPRLTMAEAYQILKGLDYKLPPEKKKVTLTPVPNAPWVNTSRRNTAMTLSSSRTGPSPSVPSITCCTRTIPA